MKQSTAARCALRPAARVHYSPEHHDAGLSQSQKLLGIRQPEPARRMERLGHIRDLAGGQDAEHRAETNDYEITDEWGIYQRGDSVATNGD